MQKRNLFWATMIVVIVLAVGFIWSRAAFNSGTNSAVSKPIEISAASGSSDEQPPNNRTITSSVTSSVSVTLKSSTDVTATVLGDHVTVTSAPSPPTSPLASPPPQVVSPLPTPTAGEIIEPVQRYTYEVVNSYPHDPFAFTQGLIWFNDTLYEGTGLRGRSSLRKVNLEDGKVLQQIDLDDRYFGEGITIWGDKIIQLTWQSRIGFMYDLETFASLDTFTYPTEGWGLTHDGTELILSDGTPTIYFLDPETLSQLRSITVTFEGEPLRQLNELEYIDGQIYANVWQTNWIAIIEPSTGSVVGMIDLTGLLDVAPAPDQQVNVLNGIAYDKENDRLFVTGKLWPRLYEIKFVLD